MKHLNITKRHGATGDCWIVQAHYTDENGKRHGKTKSVRINDYASKEDALAAAMEIRRQMEVECESGIIAIHMPTVGEAYKRKFDLIPATIKTRTKHDNLYRKAIQKYENIEISKIKRSDVQESVNTFAETQSQDQIDRLISVWHEIFLAMQMDELPVIDKTLNIIKPKQQIPAKPEKNVIFTAEQFNAYMDALLKYHEYDAQGRWRSKSILYMLQIAYHTGMQPAEIMALTSKDIDTENQTISIVKLVGSDKKNKRVIKYLKNKYRIRTIPYDDVLAPIIKELLEWNSKEYLICDYDGSLYEIDYVSNYIHLVSLKCGIQMNAYMCRHVFSNDLNKKKINPRNIQDLMGHSNANMSIQYARSDKQDLKKVVNHRKFS